MRAALNSISERRRFRSPRVFLRICGKIPQETAAVLADAEDVADKAHGLVHMRRYAAVTCVLWLVASEEFGILFLQATSH